MLIKIYVQPYPGPGERKIVSTEGGISPVWSRDGSELFYLNHDDKKMMVVDVVLQPSFSAGLPRLLFDLWDDYIGSGPTRGYDISPDGQYMLTSEQIIPERFPITQISVILNWFEELKRLCPTGK